VPIVLIVRGDHPLLDGTSDLANAVINKAEEAKTLVPTLRALLG